MAFTTAYHTQFPDYVQRRTGIPAAAVWRYIRWFHAPATHVLASTPSIRAELAAHGIDRLKPWGRGVDLSLFRPGLTPHPAMADLPPDATVADMVHADPQAAGRQARITGDAAAGAARDIAAAMPVLTAMARDLAAQWQLRLADARRRNP